MEPDEAIPTGDDNSIGTPAPAAQAAPAQTQGDSGAVGEQAIPTGDDNAMPEGPIQQQPDQQAQPKRFGPLAKIVSYLMGEGAVHPQVLTQAADQIDPESGMSASDRNLMVLEDAAKRGGKDAAWKIMQANRVAYNAKQAFGYAALNGNQQKRPDVHAAVDAANQAADHVLDGSNARFMVSTGGQITATVKGPDGQPQVFDLNPDQFRQYMNVGGAGQYDKQMQKGGIARTLTNITQNQQRVSSVAGTPPLAGAPKAAQPADATGQDQAEEPAQMSAGASGGFGEHIDSDSDYSPELQKRANRMFPAGSASNREREEWMAKQLDNENQMQNKIDVEKERGSNWVSRTEKQNEGRAGAQTIKNEGATAVANIKLKGYEHLANSKQMIAKIQTDQKAAAAGDKLAMQRISEARKQIAVDEQTATGLSPEQQAFKQALNAAGSGAMSAQQPQQQPAPQRQAPAASPGTPPVQGARFYKGQWYTRGANGEAVPYQQ